MKIEKVHLTGNYPLILLVSTSLGCIIISVFSLLIGYTIIFQNLFYIPIILACIFYTWRGFLFSCLLALTYIGLTIGLTYSDSILLQAFIRVILFVGIAGVITYLADAGKKSAEIKHHLTEFQKNIITNARVWLMVLDQKGTILLWNTAAEEITGYHSDEVTHKNDIWKLLYPEKDYRHQITETITRIIKNEKYLENFETTIRTKGGEKKVISWNTKSIPDEERSISTFIAIGVDVTDRKQAEQMLQDSEERFRLIFENLPIGLWMADKKGNLLMGNPAGQKIWGAQPHVGQQEYGLFKAWRLPSHEPIQQDDWALGYAVNEGRSTEAELLEIEAFDGARKFILNWAAPVKNTDGEIVGAFVINQDITQSKNDEKLLKMKNEELIILTEDLKESEEELQAQLEEIRSSQDMLLESEERWSDLFNRNQSAIAVYRAVDDGDNFIIEDFNPAAESIEGVKRNEIIGRRVTEIFPGIEEFGILEVFRRVWKTGVPETKDVSFYKDERIEGWRENLVYRLSSGEVVAIYSDVTERKRAENIIRETNAYLENLISIANVPIVIWDHSFRITRINRACELLVGRSAEEVIGNSLEILFPPDQADRSMRLLRTTLEGVRWETTRIDILRQDGSVRNVLWNSATLYSQDGDTPIATIAQGRDITEELRLEKEKDTALVQIQKNLAQLAILNDEIRNPLSIILAYAEMLDSEATDHIIEQTKRIDGIVNHLDQRWMQSEKVLTAIRKHYHLFVTPDSHHKKSEEQVDDQGIIPGARDSSSERKDEILIEEVQAELYTILDSIDSLIYVADMETHELLFINRLGRGVFGDIIGKKCYETIHDDQIGPCSLCTNSLLLKQSGPTKVLQREHQNSKTGRWFDCRDRAIRWTDGRMVRLEIATDITERKLEEQTLQESEEMFRAMVETLPLAIYLSVGIEQASEYINPMFMKLFGYSQDDIPTAEQWWPLAYPDETYRKQITEEWTRRIQQAIDTQSLIEPMETVVTCKDGSKKNILWGFIALGKKNYSFGLDLTEFKRSEEALHEANQKLRLLTSLTRHDIFNQLSIVNSCHDLVMDESDPADLHKYISLACQAGEKIEKTIGFTREYEDFGIVSSGWQRIHHLIESAKSEVSFGDVIIENPISETQEVYADPIMRKVFTTLIENAIRHGGKITIIRFSSLEHEGTLTISCEDDGVGIPSKEKELIFHHGYGNHTGIGLFLAREILSITGLSIRECGVEGEGARFEMMVPQGKYRLSKPD